MLAEAGGLVCSGCPASPPSPPRAGVIAVTSPNPALPPPDPLRKGDSALDQPAGLLQLLHPLPAELPPQGVAHARRAAVQREPGAAGRTGGGRGRGRLGRRGRRPARAPHETLRSPKPHSAPSGRRLTGEKQRGSVLGCWYAKLALPNPGHSSGFHLYNHRSAGGDCGQRLWFFTLCKSDFCFLHSPKLCLQYFVPLFTILHGLLPPREETPRLHCPSGSDRTLPTARPWSAAGT